EKSICRAKSLSYQMRSYKIIVTLQSLCAVSPDCVAKIQRKMQLNWVKTPKRAQTASKPHRRAVILHREAGVDAVLPLVAILLGEMGFIILRG
ncbi:MAG: hypothetical protein ACI4BC_01365, partial [Muribaculaceae bacterium]